MTEIKISVKIPEIKEHNKYRSLYDKVCDYILVCESSEESEYHWKYLKCLYKKLIDKPVTPEIKTIMKKLMPFMQTRSRFDSGEDQVDVEGTDIFKYEGDE